MGAVGCSVVMAHAGGVPSFLLLVLLVFESGQRAQLVFGGWSPSKNITCRFFAAEASSAWWSAN